MEIAKVKSKLDKNKKGKDKAKKKIRPTTNEIKGIR